jgi:putative oxidoreductase
MAYSNGDSIMDTTYATPGIATRDTVRETADRSGWKFIVPLGRALFALIFIMSGLGHFSTQMIDYAASQGVPVANLLVPISGLMAVVGGLMVLLGFYARLGALLLVAFLVPVTFMMHDFWTIQDAMQAMNQKIHFMKNLSMLGGALFIAFFGAGPVSLDARRSYIA